MHLKFNRIAIIYFLYSLLFVIGCKQECRYLDEESKCISLISDTFETGKFIDYSWEFVMDTYSVRTKMFDYNIIIDLSECDYSNFLDDTEIKVPYYVENNYERIFSGFVKYDKFEFDGGILLSFDDYFSCWDTYLPYFKKYDIKATFFCFGNYSRFGNFAIKAQNLGLEVGFHSLGHVATTTVKTKEEFEEQCIAPLSTFREKYVYLDSFAFPNGLYLPYQLDMLLDYYKIVRLFDNRFRLYSFEEIAQNRVIFTQSIDKNKFSSDKDFKDKMIKRIILAQITGTLYPCTTHYILTNPEEINNDAYTISKENLEWLFEVINILNCNTYCFKDIYPFMY